MNKYCCDAFRNSVLNDEIFFFNTEDNTKVMPCWISKEIILDLINKIGIEELTGISFDKYLRRFNYCPYCGTYIRDIEIERK